MILKGLQPTFHISQKKGVIDAAVNGGVQMYKDAFFTPEYQELHPFKVPELQKLKKALLQQMEVIEQGLTLHKQTQPANLVQLHEQLERMVSHTQRSLPSSQECL
jgi:hypothetical protein